MTEPLKPELAWDEAGCSRRECQNGHSRKWGYCIYGIEPPPTLADFEVSMASDGYASGAYVTLSVEQVADWLRKQGYAVAKDRPEDIPEDLRAIARAAFSGQPPRPDGTLLFDSKRSPWRALDDALAAAMPSYEAIVRAKVAAEIEAASTDPNSDHERGLAEAARIARGES